MGSPADTDQRVPLVRWTHGLVNRMVMLADAVTLVLAGLFLLLLPESVGLSPLQGIVVGFVAGACLVGLLRRAGAYRVERYRRGLSVAADISIGAVVCVLICGIILNAFVPSLPFGSWLLGWLVLMILALACERLVVAVMVGSVNRRGLLRSRVAIVGSNDLTQIMMSRLSAPDMQVKYELLGLFHDPEEAGTPQQSVGTIADLGRYAQSNPVDLIVVCLPWQSAERRQRIIEQVQWIAADVVIPIESGEQRGQPANIADIGGLQMLQVMNRPFKGSQGLLKIAEDYVVGALALFLTAPLMLLAAVAIRLDSPGPILFRQARTGFNNKPFMIYKFRTMRVDPADDATVGTQGRNDPRITRVGAVLRQLSIDELPQIINVLAGEMSVVGPRPYVPNMLVGNALFNDSVRPFAARHRIKPGITGWAQVNGLRGAAVRSLEGAQRSVELDIEYITQWSLWFDIKIMMRTVMVLTGRNVF
jgi:putative colanic acid biosynthesis UDP-glucose lipid carrier transferase